MERPAQSNNASETFKAFILSSPICTGKTTELVRLAAKLNNVVVYTTPSYDQLPRFLEEWKKLGCEKKVVVLQGKERLCIRRGAKLACRGCPHGKKKPAISATILTPELYVKQRACPYFNLLREARDADVILTHLAVLYELSKRYNLPYEASEATLILDEGEMALRMLSPKEVLLAELTEEGTWRWMNVGKHSLINLLDYVDIPQAKELHEFLKRTFDPNQYLAEAASRRNATFRDVYESHIPEMEQKLKEFGSKLDPIGFEYALKALRLGLEKEEVVKNLLADLVWAIFLLKEIRLNKNKRKPNVDEVWLIPWPWLTKFSTLVCFHREVVICSGSLTEREVNLVKLSAGTREREVEMCELTLPSKFTHEHVLVLVGKYNPHYLSYHLSASGYLTFVVQSSKEEAREFAKAMMNAEVATPESLDELREAVESGVKVINLVQSSRLATNLRLEGDVAIVNTYLTKHVSLYDLPEELKRKCVLGEAYQALGRIVNNEGRRVAWVVPPDVFEVLETKVREVGMTVKHFSSDVEALEEIREWIPEPIGKRLAGKKEKPRLVQRVVAVKATVTSKGKKYTYALIRVTLPPEYVGKEFEVREV